MGSVLGTGEEPQEEGQECYNINRIKVLKISGEVSEVRSE